MIKGAQQSIEYSSTATPIHHITVDGGGIERWPDTYPTIEISKPDGTQLIAPATVKAELDFGAAGCANLDTIIEASSAGTWGNDWTATVAAGASLSVVLDLSAKTITITYVDGVTTVANIVTAFAGLRGADDIFEVQSAGTPANVLASPGDDLAATALTLGAGAAMIPWVAVYEGLLDYDTETVEFEVGEKLTGGTSAATGIIRGNEMSGTTGTLHLGKVDGAFSYGEAITDSGGGTAKASGKLYSCQHSYDIDASATGTWEIDQDYHAEIIYVISGVTYKYDLYFDVAYAPMCRPFVTTQDLEESHPTWAKFLPKDWHDWRIAVKNGHSDLVRRIHKYGEQAADFVKRESEWWKIELAFIERWIAVHCGFEKDDRKYWEDNAESEWTHRGRVTVQQDDDADIEEERQNLPRSETLR